MRKLIFLVLLFVAFKASSQTYTLPYDSVRVGKTPTSSVLIPDKLYLKGLPKGNISVRGDGKVIPNDTVYAVKDSILAKGKNLYDLPNKGIARKNLGVYSITQADSISDNILPGALAGQILRATESNTNKYSASNLIDTGTYVYTPEELSAALATPSPTQEQIFNSWRRFAHGGRTNNPSAQQLSDTIPSNPSQTQSWSYDSGTRTISSTFNSGPSIGFVSPNSYNSYILEATLTAQSPDNDRVGVVLAYMEDYAQMVRNQAFGLDPEDYPGINVTDSLIANQHTITMYINRESDRPYYAIWYDYGKLSQQLIVDGSGLPGLYNATSIWGGNEVDVKVVRRGDSIYVYRTQFSDATGGKGNLGFELAISLTQNPLLYKFRGGSSYGFACNSQPNASFENITFQGGSQGVIYDLLNNVTYIPDGSGGYEQDTSITAKEAIAKGALLFNPTTNRLFYKMDNFTEIKNTTGYSLKNSIYYSVKDYGINGDGVTNVTTQLQSVVDLAASKGGGVVYMPDSIYIVRKLTDTSRTILQIPSNVILMGAGQGATKIVNDPTTPPNTANPEYATMIIRLGGITQSASNVGVMNLTVIGNSSIINAGQTSASPFRGIGSVFQVDNLADSTFVKTLHVDNVIISNVKVLDTYNGIITGKGVLGYPSIIRQWDDENMFNNWVIDNVTVNGVFNRAMEFSDLKNSVINSPHIYGAGFLHFIRGSYNIDVNNLDINYGGDQYSHDRQGYTSASPLQAGGIRLNFGVHDIRLNGGIVTDNSGIAANTYGAPIMFIYEPGLPGNTPPIYNIISNNVTYRTTHATNKWALATYAGIVENGSSMKIIDFKSIGDTYIGAINLDPTGQSTSKTLYRRWKFDNANIDSFLPIRRDSTAGTGDFTILNSSIAQSFANTGSAIKLIGTTINGYQDFSYTDSVVLDNVINLGAWTLNAANMTRQFKNMPMVINTASDATSAIRYGNQVLNLPAVTANRTLILTSSALYKGQTAIIRNGNTSGSFNWSFSASTVYTANGTAVTTLRNNATYTILSNGDGTWLLTNVTDGTVTGTGVPVFSNSPTLVAPALGTPTTLTLTNATGLPTSGLVNGAVTTAKADTGSTGLAPKAYVQNYTWSKTQSDARFLKLTDLLVDNQKTVSANYTIVSGDFASGKKTTLVVIVNATSGNVTITLPTYTSFLGYTIYVIKTDDSANTVTINTVALGTNVLSTQGQSKQFKSLTSIGWANF